MSKFGEIINSEIPVLIDFHKHSAENNEERVNIILKEVANSLGNQAKIVKIDIEKNELLVSALRIKSNPTFIIYKNAEMKWRQSGEQDALTLINLVEQYL